LNEEVEGLRQQLSEMTQHSGIELPDLEGVRDRILKSLKLGSQSPQFKSARKALDQFIREVRNHE
jgi:hypothetical protein